MVKELAIPEVGKGKCFPLSASLKVEADPNDDTEAQTMRIRKNGLDWTFVRPGILTTRFATGRY
jgi:hypothetical protein